MLHFTFTFSSKTLEKYTEEELKEIVRKFVDSISPAYVLTADEGDEHGRFHIHCILVLPLKLVSNGKYRKIFNKFCKVYGGYKIKYVNNMKYISNCLLYIAEKRFVMEGNKPIESFGYLNKCNDFYDSLFIDYPDEHDRACSFRDEYDKSYSSDKHTGIINY